MAQGTLVLASDVGGHRELIRDGVTGRLFAADDATALAAAVRSLLHDQARWGEQRAEGRRFVEEERTWPRSVGRYRSLYTSLLGQQPDAGGAMANGEPVR
jgi:glycosyltransferase involved in cell wall biosynthesis